MGTIVLTSSNSLRSNWRCTGRHMEGLRNGQNTRLVPQYDRTKFQSPAQTPIASSSKSARLIYHIPSDLVVDSCHHMLRAAQPLISRGYTTRGRKTRHK